jgi:ubiquinol-cytochrome c reductase cytochrome b subunit
MAEQTMQCENTEIASIAAAVPAGRRFASFGAGLLLLAAVAALTGLALLPFYHADSGGAYRSVQAMQASPLLRAIRAAHHWASALLILFGGAWLVYGLLSSSYRRPLRPAWIGAVGMVLLFLLFQITGHLLPWDAHGVCTASIETGIAENIPVVGPAQARALRGGDSLGPQTLAAWYMAHAVLLPAALLGLAGLFLLPLCRAGMRPAVPRAPLAAAVGVLLLVAVGIAAPLGTPTGPADYRCYAASPEWYVLPLHSLLTLAQRIRPGLAFVGSAVIPGLAILGLLALPWLDRRTVGDPPSRSVLSLTFLGVLGLLTLALMRAGDMESPFGPRNAPDARVSTSRPRISSALPDAALVKKGKSLFESSGCLGCHSLVGKGGAIGPALDDAGARHPDMSWQMRHLKAPDSVTPGSIMPPFDRLSDADRRALAAYLLSLKR